MARHGPILPPRLRRQIVLFGSCARADSTRGSDIDLALFGVAAGEALRRILREGATLYERGSSGQAG